MRGKPIQDSTEVSSAINRPLRRFAQDVCRYLPAKLIPAAAAFASTFIFTRIFSPNEFGIYSFVRAIIVPAVVVITEWASQPAGRFYSSYERQGNLQAYRLTLGTLLTIVGFSGCIVGIGLSIYVGHLWGVSMGLAAAFFLIVQSLYTLLLPIMPASLNHQAYRQLEIAKSLLILGFSLGLIYLFGAKPSSLVFGLALGHVLLLPFLFQKVATTVGGLPRLFGIAAETGRFAQYGLPMMGWFFSAQLLSIGDRYVLQAFRGSAEVGIYSANYNIAMSAAGLLSAPITLAAFPIIMYMWADGQRKNISKTISSMTEWYLIFGIGVLGITVVTANDLLSLFLGPDFREGHIVLVPVLAGQILWQVSMLGHKGMELTENTRVMLKWCCVAAAANLFLNMIFVPQYGYIAAAYSTLLSYGLYSFLIWRSSKHHIIWNVPFKSVGLALLLAAIGLAVANIARTAPAISGAVFKALIFILIYAVGIGALKQGVIREMVKN